MATNKSTNSHTATEQLRDQAVVLGHDVQKLGRIARDVAEDTWEQNRQRALDYEKSAEDQIRKYPVRSVMIAAGVGMVFGFLLGRR